MSLPISIKQKACEGLLHFRPKTTLARELGISHGAVRDWAIFIENDNFEWVTSPILPRNPERLEKAVATWFENSNLGYTEIAKRFGIRPSALFGAVVRRVKQLPAMLRPKRKRRWEPPEVPSLGKLKMTFDKLSDIPSDRPLTERERKALFNVLKNAREEEKARLVCAQCLLEVGMESCKDELKKTYEAAAGANQSGISITLICKVMGIARSTFYSQKKQSEKAKRDFELADKIESIHDDSYYTYGRRRMGEKLEEKFGIRIGECQIGRLMRANGLNARIRRI